MKALGRIVDLADRHTGRLRLVSAILLFFLGAIVLTSFFNDAVEYVGRRSLVRNAFSVMAGLAAVVLVASSMWNGRRLLWKRLYPAAILAVLVYTSIVLSVDRDHTAIRRMWRGYMGQSDLEIMTDWTRWNTYYPRESMLEEARKAIPEDEAVIYFGDLRSDPVNYALYPRPVYTVPILQQLQIAPLMDAWSETEDPGFPEGFVGTIQTFNEQDALTEEIRKLIAEKDIRWAIYISIVDPGASRFWRIERP